MSKIKNTSGEDLLVPWLGGRLVLAGQAVEVPISDVTAYTQQEATWAPADDEARRLHEEMLEGIAALTAPIATDPPGEVVEETSAAELVKAVGDFDRERTAEILAAEQAKDRPRKTVVAAAEARLAELDETVDADTTTED